MLSQTLSAPPSEGPITPEPSTRRRGLSYLRNLSSHSSSANNSDQPRISPRHFFQRSTSYNESTKAKSATGRRRSTSKPDEPIGLSLERQSLPLTRVLSAGNSPVVPQTTSGEDNSSGEDTRATGTQDQDQSAADTDNMTRSAANGVRRATDGAANAVRPAIATRAVSSTDVTNPNGSNGTNGVDDPKTKAPTIRFFPHQDFRNGRQSLNFSTISRTLPGEDSIIKVGRYSEREGLPVANPTTPSDAPVGFKSKVVSRKHCEFSCVDGQWHIKDVASSSGTFLNHIRLSQPNQESRLFPIKDGDIVQLGIDFRGGEEMIFRCVKIRIECNRSWQKKPNNFNKSRRAQLLGLTKDQPAAGQNSGECSICLGSVLPCQSLFVAPCAHVWHYKCIRPMLEGRQSQYPQFQCPNCRAWTDLEADVDIAEDEMNEWMENGGDTDDLQDVDPQEQPQNPNSAALGESNAMDLDPVTTSSDQPPADTAMQGVQTSLALPSSLLARRAAANLESQDSKGVNGINMPSRPNQEELENQLTNQRTRTESPNADQIITGEGPLTPRNDAGPFVFDGSGGSGGPRRLTVPSLPEITEGSQL